MIADVLAPRVAMPSATMILNMQFKRILVFHRNEFKYISFSAGIFTEYVVLL